MDHRTEELLQDYRKMVEKTAKSLYLQTIALRRELENTRINPEDKHEILLHCVGLLITKENKK
jgi:hypothetical protein